MLAFSTPFLQRQRLRRQSEEKGVGNRIGDSQSFELAIVLTAAPPDQTTQDVKGQELSHSGGKVAAFGYRGFRSGNSRIAKDADITVD